MTPKPPENDDLTAIPGIGPARQRWLRNTFQIHTYQDLASLSAENIQNRLKEEGQIASLVAIHAWLAKARELATSVPGSHSDEQDSLEERLTTGVSPLVRENGWKPIASFVVEFQSHQGESHAKKQRTAVHHMEADTGMTWSGIETSKLCQWMSDQVSVFSGFQSDEINDSSEENGSAEAAAPSSAKIKITQVLLFQPPKTPSPVYPIEVGNPQEGYVKGNKPFQGEIGFQVTGVSAAEITRQPVNFTLQAYNYEISSGKSAALGEAITIPLQDGKFDYNSSLQPLSLTPGKYRLWITVTLPIPFTVPDFYEIPVLNVL